jgi:ELWxxDGT repeat protein
MGDRLYFAASEDNIGYDLWTSDGTPEGTVKVRAIAPDTDRELYTLTPAGGTLFFIANPRPTGMQLWKSDGTETGTLLVQDFESEEPSYYPLNMAVRDGSVIFQAHDDAHGYELWISDGTPDGTRLLTDAIRPGRCSSFPYELVVLGDTLYFGAYGAATGYELWKLDLSAKQTIPRLAIQSAGGQVLLSWPITAAGFDLESSSEINVENWLKVEGDPTVQDGNFEQLVPQTAPVRYFRLRQP